MLAERAGIDVNEAFEWLRHHSRRHNLRLAALAQDFIGGSVPLASIGPPPARTEQPHPLRPVRRRCTAKGPF